MLPLSDPKKGKITSEVRLVIICGNAWNISLKLSETCTLRSVPMDHRLVLGLSLPGDSSSAAIHSLNMHHGTFDAASSRKKGPCNVYARIQCKACRAAMPRENQYTPQDLNSVSVKKLSTKLLSHLHICRNLLLEPAMTALCM